MFSLYRSRQNHNAILDKVDEPKNSALQNLNSLIEFEIDVWHSDFIYLMQLSVSSVVINITTGARDLGFDSLADQIGPCSQRLATTVTFLRSCVVPALSRGDKAQPSLHALA